MIDSTSAILESFAYSYEKMGYKCDKSDDEICSLIGYPLDVMYEKLGVKTKKIDDFILCYKEKYKVISKEKTKLLPKVSEAIILASSFARLGVVTTKTAFYSKELLEHFNLLKYFCVVIGREDVINPKPSPEPIIKALKELKASPEKDNIYMLGDTILDLISAKKSQVNAVAVLSGYGKEKELRKHTDNIKLDVYEAVNNIKNCSK